MCIMCIQRIWQTILNCVKVVSIKDNQFFFDYIRQLSDLLKRSQSGIQERSAKPKLTVKRPYFEHTPFCHLKECIGLSITSIKWHNFRPCWLSSLLHAKTVGEFSTWSWSSCWHVLQLSPRSTKISSRLLQHSQRPNRKNGRNDLYCQLWAK